MINYLNEMKTEPTEEMREIIERLFDFTDSDKAQIDMFQKIKREIAITAFQEGQSSPKIKQLEWVEVWEGYEDVRTPFGHYVVRPAIDNKTFLMIDLRKGIQPYLTLNEAKAAAQADFEKRVRECLE